MPIEKLVVILIHCTKYDEDGYLVQFWKGVLPCNGLAVMYSLTKQALGARYFSGMRCKIEVYDEATRAPRALQNRLLGPATSPA